MHTCFSDSARRALQLLQPLRTHGACVGCCSSAAHSCPVWKVSWWQTRQGPDADETTAWRQLLAVIHVALLGLPAVAAVAVQCIIEMCACMAGHVSTPQFITGRDAVH
jgi:hypothetical protein